MGHPAFLGGRAGVSAAEIFSAHHLLPQTGCDARTDCLAKLAADAFHYPDANA
jgi:hypothetical protein